MTPKAVPVATGCSTINPIPGERGREDPVRLARGARTGENGESGVVSAGGWPLRAALEVCVWVGLQLRRKSDVGA